MMGDERHHDFDEALISGLVDGVLTQQDEQRVRLHLETCPACQTLFDDLRSMREVTMMTRFQTPPDEQWDERPRGVVSRLSFGVGWTILLIWLVAVGGFALGQLWSGSASLIERLMIFGGLSGAALLILSVLLDRFSHLKSDRYRRVEK